KTFLRDSLTKRVVIGIFTQATINRITEMNSKEIAHLKVAAHDLVCKVQALRAEALEVDARIAAAYKQGRAAGLHRKAVKQILDELNGEAADVETVGRLYLAKCGITDADIAADNPLDAILGSR